MERTYRLFHRGGGTVFHFQSDIPPCFPFDESGETPFTFAPAGNDRIEFPMTKRFPFFDAFRALMNGGADIESAPCLFGFLTFAFVSQTPGVCFR